MKINEEYSTDLDIFSYNVTPEELFDLFGKFGPIRYDLMIFDARLRTGRR